MKRLEGKTAIVTGAGRGIGQAIARTFAGEGADLALMDLREEFLEETAAIVEAAGRRVLKIAVNVANGGEVASAVAKVQEAFGRIDILVNNAGITKDGLLVRMSEDDFDQVIDVNLKGTFQIGRASCRERV